MTTRRLYAALALGAVLCFAVAFACRPTQSVCAERHIERLERVTIDRCVSWR